MSKQQEAPAPRKSGSPELWNWLIRGVLLAIFVTLVAPRIVAELQGKESAEGAEKREAEKKEAEKADDARAASAAGASDWRPLSGGGGGGGFSSADVMACNGAAQAARRHASQRLPSDLATAMAGKSSLVGATAKSLNGVNVRTRDDARAAAVYSACISERTY